MISPDGKYAAYQSNESGRLDIYVRPFPEGSGKWLVSSNGGTLPYWSADGNELFYAQGRAIVAVRVSKGDELTFGEPQRLFESQTQIGNYAAFPDGQRFIMFRGTDLSTGTRSASSRIGMRRSATASKTEPLETPYMAPADRSLLTNRLGANKR
jgi:hypothetical protein